MEISATLNSRILQDVMNTDPSDILQDVDVQSQLCDTRGNHETFGCCFPYPIKLREWP